MDPQIDFKTAVADLELLLSQIEDETIDLELLAEKVKLAGELIEFCENKLRKIESDVRLAGKNDRN